MGFPKVFQPGWANQPAPAGPDDAAAVGEQGPEVPPVDLAKPKRRRAAKSSGQDTPES